MYHDNSMMESVYFIGSGDLLCKGKNIKSKGKKIVLFKGDFTFRCIDMGMFP